MSTTKSRINVSVSNDVKAQLIELAKRDQVPTATKAEHLMEVGLELEEDRAWDKIAAKRDNSNARFLKATEISPAFDV